MNGAESLVSSLIVNGIEVCSSNPGTSEMYFVAALDRVAGLSCVLGLHETVVNGAVDVYTRMAGKPAVTLLYTRSGFANAEMDRPNLDWVSLASGMGVRSRRAETVSDFYQALIEALEYDGPFVIEAVRP